MNVHLTDTYETTLSAESVQPVLVFKTNIRFKKDLKQLTVIFNRIPAISRWNVDTDDCDKVLRIESFTICAAQVEQIVTQAGYCCEELPD